MPDSRNKIGRWVVAALAFLGLAAVFYNVAYDNRPKGEVRVVEGYTPWEPETLRIMETLPVQDGGRVKPFSTLAGFTMFQLHGARSMKVDDGDGNIHKIRPTEWMMDALFRPHVAANLPTFRVDNSDVLEAIGVQPLGRRDRYSYNDIDRRERGDDGEIESSRQRLIELAKTYEAIERDKREPVQQQMVDLAYNIRNFESLLGYFGFARIGVSLTGSGGEGGVDRRAAVSDMMLASDELVLAAQEARAAGRPLDPRLVDLVGQVEDAANFAKFVVFPLPPHDPATSRWLSAGNVIGDHFMGESADPQLAVEDVRALESLVRAQMGGDEAAFRQELERFRDRVVVRAEERGEYRSVPLEASYYRFNGFVVALALFIVGTITALVMWGLAPGLAQRAMGQATLWLTVLATLLCTYAIVQRCIIMQRPPVGNLYDTIIFIGTTMVILALISEWFSRRGFALGLAPIIGTLLIVLARRYELGDAKDHMDPLVAVLDSNFWLTTHVIIITLGYSAGLLCAIVSAAYILLRGLGLDGGDRELRRSLTKAAYGMVCLCLFLSLVGTVLGGIWANYSWGRFWGWDPKENGALMIVIWTLVILHARLGGYIKEWGIHLASVFTACIVAFSWWHVNFLGVGLHSYGFSAAANTIWVFYSVMVLFIAFGMGAMFYERHLVQQATLARRLNPDEARDGESFGAVGGRRTP